MMTPGETSARGQLLQIEAPVGIDRLAAHVFDVPGGGIAWADSGWSTPAYPGHPFHVLTGTVDQVYDEPATWLLISADDDHVIKVQPDGVPGEPDGDRELARQMIEADLGVSLDK